ncbi:MAG: M14 family zinc carboxypeptidase [Planctomycetota bacterium]
MLSHVLKGLAISLGLGALVLANDGPYRRVVVPGTDPLTIQQLQMLDQDIVLIDKLEEGGSIRLVADDLDIARLRQAGVPFHVEIEDLVAFYKSRLTPPAQSAPGDFANGSMSGYYTYSEMVAELDRMQSLYPSLITAKFSIGNSLQGRTIWAVKISDNPGTDEAEPEVLLDAMHHAREPESMMAQLYFMWHLLENYGLDPEVTFLVDNREMYFVPIVNPDGYVYNEQTNPNGGGLWRKNRRNNGGGSFGVDLNRNYSYQWGYDNNGSSGSSGSETYRGTGAFSEPETQHIRDLVLSRSFSAHMSNHTYGAYMLYPWGYESIYTSDDNLLNEYGNRMNGSLGYAVGTSWEVLYEANGTTFDYSYGDRSILASFTMELGYSFDGFWPPTSRIIPIAQETLPAHIELVRIGGDWLEITNQSLTQTSGDGDGDYEPGEAFQISLTAFNVGQATTGTGVTLSLQSPSSDVIVTSGNDSLGFIGARGSATNSPGSIAFSISPSATIGTTVDLTLDLDYDGTTFSQTIPIDIGSVRRFIVEDLEADRGWIIGAPGDNASTGIWTRGNPNGTTSSGQQVQTENDHTPGAGNVAAFVTGNSSSSGAGDDDVDGGPTTLRSPIFDLSGVSNPTISYWRWFADFTTADDNFRIDISNNGGGSWTNLETVTSTDNTWRQVEHRVSDFVAPTTQMQLRFIASDSPNNSLYEAAIDDLEVSAITGGALLGTFGTAGLGQTVDVHLAGESASTFTVYVGLIPASIDFPGIGNWGIDPSILFPVSSGTIPASGLSTTTVTVPNIPGLSGQTVYLQAIVNDGGQFSFSNRTQADVP